MGRTFLRRATRVLVRGRRRCYHLLDDSNGRVRRVALRHRTGVQEYNRDTNTMSPLYSIRPEAVAIIDAADKPAILDRLSQTFAHSWGLDAAMVLEQLEERERLGSTGFGRGVAIPHARIPGISRPVAALLKLRQPADFASADGLPVDIVLDRKSVV